MDETFGIDITVVTNEMEAQYVMVIFESISNYLHIIKSYMIVRHINMK